jgi:hypothetical protein
MNCALIAEFCVVSDGSPEAVIAIDQTSLPCLAARTLASKSDAWSVDAATASRGPIGIKALAFDGKPATFRGSHSLIGTYMHGVLPILGLSLVLMQPALAQGIKDPPNYPMSPSQHAQKAQTSQSASRPTTIRNVATGSLPAGVAVQRVHRDGKLVALPRY